MMLRLLIFTQKKTMCSSFKRKQDFFVEKNRGFVDSEFLTIFHEEVILPLGKCESTSQLSSKGILQGEEWRDYSCSRYFYKNL